MNGSNTFSALIVKEEAQRFKMTSSELVSRDSSYVRGKRKKNIMNE